MGAKSATIGREMGAMSAFLLASCPAWKPIWLGSIYCVMYLSLFCLFFSWQLIRHQGRNLTALRYWLFHRVLLLLTDSDHRSWRSWRRGATILTYLFSLLCHRVSLSERSLPLSSLWLWLFLCKTTLVHALPNGWEYCTEQVIGNISASPGHLFRLICKSLSQFNLRDLRLDLAGYHTPVALVIVALLHLKYGIVKQYRSMKKYR